ncbi:MAG: beta-glucosidase [Acholeplasmataceae bacterium]
MLKYKDLISKMTLEEKASLLSGKDFWQTRDIQKYGIPSMFCADGPHGIRKQRAAADHLGLNPSYEATCFPTSAAMANSFDVNLIHQVGIALGKEAQGQAVNILLGPGTNIKRNPLAGRNFEYFSEDPYLSGKMTAAHISGIQKAGVSGCAKHFAANNQEFKRLVIDSIVDERTLREIYLMPFELAVKEGKTKTIMASYNKLNGIYTNEHPHIHNQILRKEWKYKGIVISDWGGSNDRVEALKANAELEMPTTAGETNYEVVRAVQEGVVEEKLLDENIDRLLEIIFTTHEAVKNAEPADFEAHHELALQVAEESAVLLKNENVLPLSGEKVCIIGDFANVPRYQGAGSSKVNPTKLESTIKLIGEYTDNYVGFERGFKRFGKKSKGLIKKAVKLASQADVILLYVGLDEATEAEGIDRSHMRLPQNQLDLFKALRPLGKKIVVVMSTGVAVEFDVLNDADAILHGYLAGQAGMKGLLNVLFGKTNPSGKLSESLPYKYEDTPSAPYFPGVTYSVEYKEGLFVGYRYYDTVDKEVNFPFGYGLSYTTFSYDKLEVHDDHVEVTVTNTGKVKGKEVVQLYVGLNKSEVIRPKKELKGFVKVELEPKETKTVKIPFDEYTFRYFDINTNKYEIEKGTYQLYVGSSVRDIHLEGEIEKEGIKPKVANKEILAPYYSGDILEISDEVYEALLGRPIPQIVKPTDKRGRIIVDHETTVAELRKAKGWTGRFFSWVIRFAIKLLKAIGKYNDANTLIMGVLNQPMRAISRMTAGMLNYPQLDGLITMFNGKFFKGFKQFRKAGKAKKQFLKQEKERVKATEVN